VGCVFNEFFCFDSKENKPIFAGDVAHARGFNFLTIKFWF
jgi:hypothetical protein